MALFETMAAAVGGGAIIEGLGGLVTNIFGKRAADKQMAFQERMRNTAYQAAMADMRKAGLNPMLAYSKGGAAVPAGAQPNFVNPAKGAAQNALAVAQAKKMDAEINQLDANTALAMERAATERRTQENLVADTGLKTVNQELAQANILLTSARTDTEYQNAQVAASVFQNNVRRGRIMLEELTVAQQQATAAAIRQAVQEKGVADTRIWLEEAGIWKPSEIIEWAAKKAATRGRR